MKEKDCSYLRHIALKQELIDLFSLSYLFKGFIIQFVRLC